MRDWWVRWPALTLAALSCLGHASFAAAEDWPTRPLTMINPFAPGRPNDVPARLFAQRMGEILGQSVVVENVGGAGGMNGASRVAKAQPDGYTFLLGTVGTQAQNQTLLKKPAYDSAKDFVSVGLFLEAPLVLVARKDLPVNSMQEFVVYAKANSDKMQFGSAGTGSAIHLGCALMNSVAGLNIVHVPYRGSNPRDAGSRQRTGRLSLRHRDDGQAADRWRCSQADCRAQQQPFRGTARCADGR
jgi:tripartite-type tricarboxylate transporter receptor subunit TctC